MGPLFKERFISISVAEFSKGGRRFKHTSDCLHLSAAKYFSDIFILVIIKLLLYIHTVQTLTYMRGCAILKKETRVHFWEQPMQTRRKTGFCVYSFINMASFKNWYPHGNIKWDHILRTKRKQLQHFHLHCDIAIKENNIFLPLYNWTF